MFERIKRFFKKPDVKPAPPPAHVRNLVYLKDYFAQLEQPGISADRKQRLKYAIADRQSRLTRAGILAPTNLAKCETALNIAVNELSDVH